MKKHFFFFLSILLFFACVPPKKTGKTGQSGKIPPKTNGTKPKTEPMDTVRWTNEPNPKPPITSNPNSGGAKPNNPPTNNGTAGSFAKDKFRIAVLLPFLSNKLSDTSAVIPEKSSLAVQFYGGLKLALEDLSKTEGMTNLTIDVYDTQLSDAEFAEVQKDYRLENADLFIGPMRGSHVSAFAQKTKMWRKPLISPESPNENLTNDNPFFIQTNPSLSAHCEAVTKHILKIHKPENVVLVGKEKEASRFEYFQQWVPGTGSFHEVKVPDNITDFSKTDLSTFFKIDKTTVFVLPSWASEEYVFAFLRKVKTSKGKNKAVVYGMPQWLEYPNIDTDYFQDLTVHLPVATWYDEQAPEITAFRQRFIDAYGTLPNDDAFNGYDVMRYVGLLLKQHGKDFYKKAQTSDFRGLARVFDLRGVGKRDSDLPSDSPLYWNYQENLGVQIIKFQETGFSLEKK